VAGFVAMTDGAPEPKINRDNYFLHMARNASRDRMCFYGSCGHSSRLTPNSEERDGMRTLRQVDNKMTQLPPPPGEDGDAAGFG
jgi:hypothetical protein